MIVIVVAHFRSHSVWRFDVRWLIIAICAASLATAKADAIEIGAPKSALDRLELTDAQVGKIAAATRNYKRTTTQLTQKKARRGAALIAGLEPELDHIADVIQLEARILAAFVSLRTRVYSSLREQSLSL
jgi:hypothetical protein